MIKLFLWSIQKRWQQVFLVITAAIILTAAFTAFASSISSITVIASDSLDQYWRTTYDILVRSPDAVNEIEREYGLVRANHLSGTSGGITLEQWEQIKAIPEVEVAAPIAMLGYLPRDEVMLGIRDPLPDGIYRVWAESMVSDGWDESLATLPAPYYTLYLNDNTRSAQSQTSLLAEITRLQIADLNRSDLFGLTIGLPKFEDQMLAAAIDPGQEARLAHLDGMVVEGAYLPEESAGQVRNGIPRIPILMNVHDYVNMQVSYRVERVDLPLDSQNLLQSLQAIPDAGAIRSAPRTFTQENSLTVPREWREQGLLINLQDGQFQGSQAYLQEFSGPLLRPGPVSYAIRENLPEGLYDRRPVLEALPIGLTSIKESGTEATAFLPEELAKVFEMRYWQRTPELVFRQLEPRLDQEISFRVDVMGVFEIDPREALEGASLNQVPLETYYPPQAVLKYGPEGEPIENPPVLNPTLNDAGYLASPPDILVDIRDVPLLFEHGCSKRIPSETTLSQYESIRVPCSPLEEDWISAIRVRVSGIDEIDARAQAGIERVAQEIMERTGLHVDIMVGSSPQPVLVHLPGYGGIPAAGYVEEQWVKKNVNTLVQTGMNRADRLLFGGMLAACVLFLFNANYLSILGRMSEFGLLKAIGWRTQTISAMLVGEALSLGLLSGLLGAALSLAVSLLLRLPLPVERILLIVPLGGLAFLVGSLLPAWQAARTAPVTALRAAETSAGRRLPVGGSFLGYALSSLVRRPARSLAGLAGLALGSGMLVLLKLAIDQMQGELYGTLLGSWIRTQVQPYHFLMGAITLLVSATGVALAMLVNFRQRRAEIGLLRAVGWRQGDVFRLVLVESGLLGLAGGLLGTALAMGLILISSGSAFNPIQSLPAVLGPGMGLPVLVTLLASLYPALRTARLLPLDALRGEERLGSARPVRAQLLWIGVALPVVLGLAVGLGQVWQSSLKPQPLPAASAQTPTPTLPSLEPWQTPTPVDLKALPEYRIDLEIDVEDRKLLGEEEITWINATGDELQTIVLRLYPNLSGAYSEKGGQVRLEALEISAGAAQVDYAGDESVVVVQLENSAGPGEQIQVRTKFVLDLPPFDSKESQLWMVRSFFPMLAVYENGAWRTDVCATCVDVVYSQSAQYDLRVTAPQGWRVVAGSDPLSSTPNREEGIIHTFKTESGPVRDLALAISPDFRVFSRLVGETRISLYLPGTAEAGVDQEILFMAAEAFTYYTQQFGPYPYPALSIVAVPAFPWLEEGAVYAARSTGMEYPGLISLGYLEGDPELPRVIAHEVAHQWWYGLAGNDVFNEAWLDESLAEYSALLFLRDQGRDTQVEPFLGKAQRQVQRIEILRGEAWKLGSSVYDFPDFSTYSRIVYSKGPLFLEALQEETGSEAFFAGLQQYLEWHRFGVGTGRGFLEAMQEASGRDLRPLFEEWVGLDSLQ